MFTYESVKSQTEKKSVNAEVNEAVQNQLRADIEYIAMMADVQLTEVANETV